MLRRQFLQAFALASGWLGLGKSASAEHADRDQDVEGTAARPMIVGEGGGDHLIRRTGPMGGLPFIIKLDARTGGTRDFFVFTEVLHPGQSIPFHRHDNCEELLLFEEDGAVLTIGSLRAAAGRRSMGYVPRRFGTRPPTPGRATST